MAQPRQPVSDQSEATSCVTTTFKWFMAAAILTWLVVGVWPLTEMARGRFEHGGAAAYVASFLAYGAAMFIVLFMPRRRRTPPRVVPISLALIQTITGILMN